MAAEVNVFESLLTVALAKRILVELFRAPDMEVSVYAK